MTVLVTGAAGLLGSHVTDLLVEAGEATRVLVLPADVAHAHFPEAVDVRVGDVCDPDAVEDAVAGVGCVLNCAARTGPWGPDAAYERTNVTALADLVRLSVAAGVERIVHVSSVTVHGNDVDGSADETSPFRVEPNPYSRTKVEGERLLQRLAQHDGAPVVIVRPGWIYGPRDAASFGRFARMIETRKMVMIGRGDNHVPLVYVGDAASGVVRAGRADVAPGRAYLLVNDEPVTQRAYLGAIAAELGVDPPRRRLPYRPGVALAACAELAYRTARRDGPPPVMRYGIQLLGGDNRFSIARAREELGFSPEVMMAEGVKRGIEWYRSTMSRVGR